MLVLVSRLFVLLCCVVLCLINSFVYRVISSNCENWTLVLTDVMVMGVVNFAIAEEKASIIFFEHKPKSR